MNPVRSDIDHFCSRKLLMALHHAMKLQTRLWRWKPDFIMKGIAWLKGINGAEQPSVLWQLNFSRCFWPFLLVAFPTSQNCQNTAIVHRDELLKFNCRCGLDINHHHNSREPKLVLQFINFRLIYSPLYIQFHGYIPSRVAPHSEDRSSYSPDF